MGSWMDGAAQEECRQVNGWLVGRMGGRFSRLANQEKAFVLAKPTNGELEI